MIYDEAQSQSADDDDDDDEVCLTFLLFQVFCILFHPQLRLHLHLPLIQDVLQHRGTNQSQVLINRQVRTYSMCLIIFSDRYIYIVREIWA